MIQHSRHRIEFLQMRIDVSLQVIAGTHLKRPCAICSYYWVVGGRIAGGSFSLGRAIELEGGLERVLAGLQLRKAELSFRVGRDASALLPVPKPVAYGDYPQ
jgi:hypothetical protein